MTVQSRDETPAEQQQRRQKWLQQQAAAQQQEQQQQAAQVGHDDVVRQPRPVPPTPPRAMPGMPGMPGMAQRAPRGGGTITGMFGGASVERWFIGGLRVAAILLLLLSVLGTFYGLRGAPIPITNPGAIIASIGATGAWFAGAVAIQAFLSLVQWGSRQAARRDRRWWYLYLLALAPSVYLNWAGYAPPLQALGWPELLTGAVILGGDIIPELVLVRD